MKKMKRFISLGLAVCCVTGLLGINTKTVSAAEYWPEEPQIESPNAIIMEASTGTVLYEKNAHESHYPASITKIMTTLLALENCSMDETVTFSKEAVYNTHGSGIYRDVDEQMTMEQTLYAVMLESSNECAYAVAEHVGGSYDKFIEMMNEKAEELGCTDTHFSNPHGLTDVEGGLDHYTSCYDMALIAKEAYKSDIFRAIIGTAAYQIPPTNKHNEITYLRNHNEMLHAYRTRGEYVYEYCVGGKTGYTDAANSTLVTYAQKDGMTLICVIMNTQSPAQWKDSIALYNYYLDNFTLYNVSKNETRITNGQLDVGEFNMNPAFVKLDSNAAIVLPKTAEFSEAAPKISYENSSDDVLATVEYTFADHEVGGADIIADKTEVKTFDFDNLKSQEDKDGKKKFQINILTVFLWILGIAAAGVIIWLLKLFFDNIYIIRHKFFSRPRRDKRYKIIKNRYHSRHRRRHR